MNQSQTIKLGNYSVLFYKSALKSTITDYDYDNNGRRFISTYLNHMCFLDPITSVRLLELSFPDDTADNICSALLNLYDNLGIDNNDEEEHTESSYNVISIDIPPSADIHTGGIIFSKMGDGTLCMCITISQVHRSVIQSASISIILTEESAEKLYDTLRD